MENFWDKKYLKIVYHAVLFVALGYIAIEVINFAIFSLTDMGAITSGVGEFFGGFVSVFLPLVIAVIFGFLFDPLVYKIQDLYEFLMYEKFGLTNKKKNIVIRDGVEYRMRPVGAAGTIVAFFGFLVLLIRAFVLIILDGAKSLSGNVQISDANITNYFNQVIAFLDTKIVLVQDKLEVIGLGKYAESIVNTIYSLIESLINLISSVALNLGSLIMAVSSSVVTLLISTVIAYYVMKDKEILISKGKKFFTLFLPHRAHKVFSGLFIDVATVFSNYIRGMLIDVTVIAMLVSLALSLIGIPYAFIIGIISGFANFIPYLGSFTAAVLAILSAALTGDMTKVLLATVAVIVIQQIDSLIVVPRALGSSVEISPLLVILSLSVAGSLFGLVGMIIAVPTTALIKIFIERLVAFEEETGKIQGFYKKLSRNKAE